MRTLEVGISLLQDQLTDSKSVPESVDRNSLLGYCVQTNPNHTLYESKDLNGDEVSFKISLEQYQNSGTSKKDRNFSRTDNRILYYRELALSDFDIIKSIAEQLTQGTVGVEQKAEHLLNWVQSKVFYDHQEQILNKRYLRTPVETLYERTGDCEDRSILFAAMCHSIGIDPVILNFGNVISVGIEGNFTGSHLNIDGRKFYLADMGSKALPTCRIGTVQSQISQEHLIISRIFTDKILYLTNESKQKSEVVIPISEYVKSCENKTLRNLSAFKNEQEAIRHFLTTESDIAKGIANALTSGTGTQEQKLQNILSWTTNHIPYYRDLENRRGSDSGEYWRYPIQTIFEKRGDCEDTSLLFASLVLASNFINSNVAMAVYNDHICPLVKGNFEGWHYRFKNEKYYIAETATDKPNSKIGTQPIRKTKPSIFVFSK